MKKFLTLLLFVPFVLQAQESGKVPIKPNFDNQADVFKPYTGENSTPAAQRLKKNPVKQHTVIGQTFYDLQTNGSMARRIIAYPDGRLSAVWTNAETGGFDNRGTGYNHFDGTNWLPLSSVAYRIENESDIQTPNRIGWANIGHVGNTKEFTIGHSATHGGFVYSENNAIGGTNWSSSEIFNGGPLWGQIAQGSNGYLYMLATYTVLTPGDTPTVNGLVRPVVFYRSSDNGNTWLDEAILLPGYDTSRYNFGSADSYTIDAQDSTVAIVIGTSATDLALWKSTDWGATWNKTVIDSFPVSPQQLRDDVLFDSTVHNDGSYNVVLDDNGVAHVFWGLRSIQNTDATDDSYSFFFFNNGLGYWNDQNQVKVDAARIVDDNQSGRFDGVPSSNFSRNTDGSPDFQYGSSMLVTQPTASIDANGNIYCFYRSVVESPLDEQGGSLLSENFSDIYVIFSQDGGATWSTPQNLTKNADEFIESVFPSTYRRAVNGEFHVIWQEDFAIGTAAQNQHGTDTNDIVYSSYSVSDILNNRYGMLALSVAEKANDVFNVARTYPNPATDMVNVELNLKKGAAVNVTLRNIVGQELKNKNYGKMPVGSHRLPLSTLNLKSGVYFITVTAEGFSSTHKVVVQ